MTEHPTTSPTPVLEARGIDKHFGGLHAIQELDLTVEPGRITALIGANGAGKTTAFNLITGVIQPDAGEVLFQGKPITGSRPDEVAHLGIGRTFQDLRLFSELTCEENVMVAFPDQYGERVLNTVFLWRQVRRERVEIQQKARSLLELVGLADRADSLAKELGYAEAKMLALARALALDASLLLLDEPCSGLDSTALSQVQRVLATLLEQGRTICLIEHNMSVVREVSSWGIFLERGALVASAPVEDLMADKEIQQRYLGIEVDE